MQVSYCNSKQVANISFQMYCNDHLHARHMFSAIHETAVCSFLPQQLANWQLQ